MRWDSAIKDKALDSIRNLVVIETRVEHFLEVLETGTVSTNSYLPVGKNLLQFAQAARKIASDVDHQHTVLPGQGVV